ncbi:MAG: prephenate dehydrogenase/arogenate dehydrogenase family protein [Coriobacteriia bacterium]|nr:prephenate dehydrogenase/arogenate dehydrogenase family protein [Coriobacteriia bacterium]
MSLTVGIIGLGLIGGSFAKTIAARTDARVLGTDIDKVVVSWAISEGAIVRELDDRDLTDCDFVILALRPQDAIDWMIEHVSVLSDESIIFDVGGIKRRMSEEVSALCAQRGLRFVGAHPMAGYHEGGFAHSSEHLFDGASFIISTDEHTDPSAVNTLEHFVETLGFGQVVVTTPDEHDEIVAFTSQLAHLVSSAYIKDPDALRHAGFSAGSFQDMTRVAILDADMWSELMSENADMLVPHIDNLLSHLSQYRDALSEGDRDRLARLLQDGVDAKRISIESCDDTL